MPQKHVFVILTMHRFMLPPVFDDHRSFCDRCGASAVSASFRSVPPKGRRPTRRRSGRCRCRQNVSPRFPSAPRSTLHHIHRRILPAPEAADHRCPAVWPYVRRRSTPERCRPIPADPSRAPVRCPAAGAVTIRPVLPAARLPLWRCQPRSLAGQLLPRHKNTSRISFASAYAEGLHHMIHRY